MEKRIHILNGFALIFDALDEIIRIIRASDGKADAAKKIMKKFPVDTLVAAGSTKNKPTPFLELKLYRLARLEINLILDELKDKQKRAQANQEAARRRHRKTPMPRDGGRSFAKRSNRWSNDYGKDAAGKRRTVIDTVEEEPEYTAEDFIVAEDCHVLITKDGWVKRQKQIADPSKSRLRQGDSVLACVAGSTREIDRLLFLAGRLLHRADDRHPGVDRIRRTGAEAVQDERWRTHCRSDVV